MTIYTLLTFFKDGMLPIKHSTVLSISKIKYNEQIIATELQNNDKVIKIFLFCKILVFFYFFNHLIVIYTYQYTQIS